MRILYVNHTGEVSGAERSLFDLLDGLPSWVEPEVACPSGELMDGVVKRGIAAHPIHGTDASFRLHPLHTSRGLVWLARTGQSLRSLARTTDAALIHANSVRAGLAAGLAARFGAPPAVVHFRDRLPNQPAARLTLNAIELGATVVIANSRYVAGQLQVDGGRAPVRVIYSPLDVTRFNPDRIDREEARRKLGLGDQVVVAVVAQLTPWKGQDDAIRMMAFLRAQHPDVRLLLIGSVKFTGPGARYDNVGYERRLRRLAWNLGLERVVLFLGEREDVPELLRAVDLVLVPSWEEPFGRATVEAMAMRVPVVATKQGGPAEVIRDDVEGRLLPPRRPELWAQAVAELLAQPELRSEMGRRGRERAVGQFSARRHVEEVTALYEEIS